MMNGSIILCDAISFDDKSLATLHRIRGRVYGGLSGLYALYGEFSPERLGHHSVHAEMCYRAKPKETKQILAVWTQAIVFPIHITKHTFRIYDVDIPIHLTQRGNYAIDLIVDGIICATTSLEVL
jgi:hypothetical protein